MKLRDQILERDGFVCQVCLRSFSDAELEMHHIIPKRLRGIDSPNNLTTTCRICHKLIEIQRFVGCLSFRTRSAIAIGLPETLVQKIDSDRGDVSRSRFIVRLIREAFEIMEKGKNDINE